METKICEQCHAEKGIGLFRKVTNQYTGVHPLRICKECYQSNQDAWQQQQAAEWEARKALREKEHRESEAERLVREERERIAEQKHLAQQRARRFGRLQPVNDHDAVEHGVKRVGFIHHEHRPARAIGNRN